MADAVADIESQVAVVANGPGDRALPFRLDPRRGGELEILEADGSTVAAGVDRARVGAAVAVGHARRLPPVDEVAGDLLKEAAGHGDVDITEGGARGGE